MENLKIKDSGIIHLIGKLSMSTIPENALLHGVVLELSGREAFKDADTDNTERIYHGDVFEAILGEMEGRDGIFTVSPKVIDQLYELAFLVSTDYVMITNS